ncbi:deoxynucleoside kinase [Caldisalinibacter kiritimatiensis]|uniref:Deoxyadenosine kinase / Deoxyguanosine kinase n=1 Tax=Caldisalinibacter kiritimatiensis TaxID=1304284 RepID=R1CFM1_9FIRM|nr:deoxynucleoside kinase [Caldisalinibacter kiritimatiensis]EOD01100.1 Deoxyadenosine kinase / Deoxyguanosine kinase [Caldisalinibacter kiritimatiensis]
METNQNNISLIVDGVVGVGKSTLMRILEEKRGYKALPEPVIDNPLLDRFYEDRKRYSFPLQILFLNRRFKHIKEASKLNKVVMDRSIYTDIIFAKQLRDIGDMDKEEYDIYYDLLHNMLEHCEPPTLMIYLEISTDNAISRIRKRGRDFEQHVERDYWEELNKNYDDFFESYNYTELLKINVDGIDFENNPEHQKYVLNLIDNKLRELGKLAG